MEIKQYTKKYLNQYCKLYIETWKEEPYGEIFIGQEVQTTLEQNQQYQYLLLRHEEVIGFVSGRPLIQFCDFFDNSLLIQKINMNKAFYISDLSIKSDYRKLGLGAVLINFLIAAARADNYSEFVLRTHQSFTNPALSLYYNLGMKTRLTKTGKVHQVKVSQARIDNRPVTDSRIYFYKVFK